MNKEKELEDKLFSAYLDVNVVLLKAQHAKESLSELYKAREKKTKGQLIEEIMAVEGKFNAIDSALPQDWVNDVLAKTGQHVVPYMAWAYHKDGSSGPIALTELGETVLEIYNFIMGEKNNTTNWSAEAMIRRC